MFSTKVLVHYLLYLEHLNLSVLRPQKEYKSLIFLVIQQLRLQQVLIKELVVSLILEVLRNLRLKLLLELNYLIFKELENRNLSSLIIKVQAQPIFLEHVRKDLHQLQLLVLVQPILILDIIVLSQQLPIQVMVLFMYLELQQTFTEKMFGKAAAQSSHLILELYMEFINLQKIHSLFKFLVLVNNHIHQLQKSELELKKLQEIIQILFLIQITEVVMLPLVMVQKKLPRQLHRKEMEELRLLDLYLKFIDQLIIRREFSLQLFK